MPGAFLAKNQITPSILLTATGATVPSMPIANLHDAQPRARVRFPSGSATILADLAGSTANIETVAILSTNCTPSATIRIRLSRTDGSGNAGDVWDSGTVNAGTGEEAGGNIVMVAPSVVVGVGGTLPLGADSTHTVDSTSIEADNTTQFAPEARYLKIELNQGGGDALDIGLIVAGSLLRIGMGMLYGMQEGRAILDRRERNPFTGAEFVTPALGNPRRIAFTLNMRATPEQVAMHRWLVHELGGAGDALWIPDLADSRTLMNLRSVWGAVNPPGGEAMLVTSSAAFAQRQFVLTERL